MWVYTYQPQIRIPSKGYKPYVPFWSQQQVLRDDSHYRHVNKSRQIGYTTTFAIEALHDFIYTPTAEIIVLSKSEKEAKKFLDKFYVALDSVQDKDPFCPKVPVRNTFNAESDTGSTINVLTSSKGAGRSFSASRLYFDEMAHTQYADEIYQASIPTVSTTGGKVTLFSSPKGREGLFAKIGREWQDQGYSSHTYQWWFDPSKNPYYEQFLDAWIRGEAREAEEWIAKARTGTWYKENRKRYTDLAFAQEFECNYDADVDSVFNQRQLAKALRRNWLMKDEESAYEVWSMPPVEGHDYVTGIDLGRKRDATVMITFDVTEVPATVVEYKRIPPSTSDWTLIEHEIRKTYGIFESDMLHDGTGVGDSITDRIMDISEPFNFTASKKYNLLENLRRSMDTEAIRIPRLKQLVQELEGYIWNDKHIVQDSVIALALAVWIFYEFDTVVTGGFDIDYVGSVND